ncbi:MAG TPA: hypothetical protein DDY70_06145 [Clostridiales bacterium]|nr:hypothetical protein [Clostridiales bacterium]
MIFQKRNHVRTLPPPRLFGFFSRCLRGDFVGYTVRRSRNPNFNKNSLLFARKNLDTHGKLWYDIIGEI